MTTSLSNPSPSARPVDSFDGDPPDEENLYEARMHGLSHQQLADRLNWLSWYQPSIFTAVMDYMDFSDALSADADPASPESGDRGCDEEPAPVCGQCGADIGIFIKFGLDWRHYVGTTFDDIELFDPGHAPLLAWRIHAPATT
jgi:hypothetical protein